ncbi:MAG TPA: DoxX family protein [Terriglobales bacterium]|nr:DoxX family protein [Terriglobales bacterium]
MRIGGLRLGGWILSGLLSAFLLWDAWGKITMQPFVVTATAKAGLPVSALPGIGTALLISTILYLIPRTLLLGSILLAAYLGGAVASGVLTHQPTSLIVFPIVFGILVWIGTFLRDSRYRSLL